MRRLQQGEKLGLPHSRPLPTIGSRCHELRIRDQNINWRIIYRIDSADCFGGTGVLTYSFLGATDVVGAVSLHGGLMDFPTDHAVNHPVLVLSGGDDDTGTQVDDLEASLDAANAT